MNAQKSDKSGTQATAPAAKVTETTKAQPKVEKPEAKESKPVSSVMSQREAVYQEIVRVLHEDKVAFDGSASVKALLTDDRLKRVYDGIAQGFRNKKVALKDNANNQNE
jgi:shikimate kinase